MAWLRLDDGFAQHPKIVALTPRDRWTWLELLCYCARYRTEGQVPAGIAEVVRGATPAFLQRALESTLLDPVPGTTCEYHVHDWIDYNPARIDDADEAVAAYLTDNPQASANEVWRAIGGSRNAILTAVRRYRNGTQTVPTGTEMPVREPVSRARSRPVPSRTTQEEPPAAAAAQPRDDPAAAARTIERLDQLGLGGHALAASHPTRVIDAWLDLADTEADRNPAAFVLAGIRSGQTPTPRAPAAQETDPTDRRRRFVEANGWRLPTDQLEDELTTMGAHDDELVGLLETAADLRSAAAA